MNLRTRVATAATVLLLLGACGGGGGSKATPENATPGAAIDSGASGVITGPINKARSTVTALNNQQQQEEQQTATDG